MLFVPETTGHGTRVVFDLDDDVLKEISLKDGDVHAQDHCSRGFIFIKQLPFLGYFIIGWEETEWGCHPQSASADGKRPEDV